MITLNEKSTKKFYFVLDEVIFNITTSNPNNDSCGKEIGGGKNDSSIPTITVKKDGEQDKTYYLDVLIQDGDKCKEADDKFNFTHSIHSSEESGETDGTFCDYYIELCKEQIGGAIKSKLKNSYDYFSGDNLSRLGVPTWMFSGQGYTLESSEESESFAQIDFTEKMFDEIKEEQIIKLSLEAANNKAKVYGYEVKNKTLEIEKIKDNE